MLVQGTEHAVYIPTAKSYNGQNTTNKILKYIKDESDLIYISNIKISVKIRLFGFNWKKCIKKLLKKQG